ncbi:unnamed protein product, partial [Sphacelaria rigidula]
LLVAPRSVHGTGQRVTPRPIETRIQQSRQGLIVCGICAALRSRVACLHGMLPSTQLCSLTSNAVVQTAQIIYYKSFGSRQRMHPQAEKHIRNYFGWGEGWNRALNPTNARLFNVILFSRHGTA